MNSLFSTQAFKTNLILTSVLRDTKQTYTVKYVTGISDKSYEYRIRYDTKRLETTKIKYVVRYTTTVEDTKLKYRIRYNSGRELNRTSLTYVVKYNTTSVSKKTLQYTLKYLNTSPVSSRSKKVFRIKYTVDSTKSTRLEYKIKYTKENFKKRSVTYSIKYINNTPFQNIVSSVLLKSNDKNSVLFLVRARKTTDNIFVFSNLPRYQLVEINNKFLNPNVIILDTNEVKELNIFNETIFTDAYKNFTYILVEDVNIRSQLNLDTFDKNTLESTCSKRSFLFNINSDQFYPANIELNSVEYDSINYNSRYFNYSFLNFISDKTNLKFNKSGDCCLTQRISSPLKNTKCSPF